LFILMKGRAMERYFEHRDLPDEKERLRERALAYCDLDMYREAIAEYEKIIKMDSGDPWSYLDLGICLGDKGERDKAMKCYLMALKIFPRNSNLYLNLGYCFEKHLKRCDMAAVCYEKALELDPGDEWALNNIGSILQKEGKWKEALTYYEAAYAARKGDNNHILHNLAWAYYHCKNYKKAWSLYSKLIHEYPDRVSVYADFTCVNYRLGRIEEALGLLDNVLEQFPKNRHCRKLYKLIIKQME